MTAPDTKIPAHGEARRMLWDRYVLDLDRGCLLLEGSEIALRPKTFAVLVYLVENHARLVSKGEIFAAVWPNITVTDDTLVQSIGELRRALGDDGSRLVRTVPRRGYRLDGAVQALTPSALPVMDSAGGLPAVALGKPPRGQPYAARWPVWSSLPIDSWRAGLLAASAIAVLLSAAVLWSTRSSFDATSASARNAREANKPVVALLPLLYQGSDPARAYFADGMTQDVINALGRFSELTVMSWNAVLPYKGKAVGAAEIAQGLGARYYIEGSIRQADGRVRATAQLADAQGRVLWSGRFDEALADLFALQDKMTAEIAGALAIGVTRFEQIRASAKPTASLEAYDYALRVRPALQQPSRAGIVEARELLKQAIQLAPGYAAAYAALAETHYIDVSMGWAQSPIASLSRADEMANKALSVDSADVRARIVLGRIHIFYHRYEQAKAEIDRAIAINPSDAHALAGRGNILVWSGQTAAAIDVLELAQRIDPELNALDTFALSLAYYLNRRYAAAAEQAVLNLRKTQGAHFSRAVLAAAYAQQGRQDEAVRVARELRSADPTFDPFAFGTKLLAPADLEHLRDGFRKAGL